MLPLEFILDGPPVSQGASRRGRVRWKSKIQAAIQAQWNEEPVRHQVEVEITNFYRNDIVDVDNVIKPILDAMKGLVYADDSQVAVVVSRKRSLIDSFRVQVRSADMEHALRRGTEFVHVAVRVPVE